MGGSVEKLLLSVVLMAVLTQLHLSSIALAAVALIGMLFFRPRIRFLHVGAGAVLFIILYLPDLGYELTNEFPNVRAVLLAGTSSQGMINLSGLASVMGNVLLFFSRAMRAFMISIEWPHTFRMTFWILYKIESLCVVIGIAICIHCAFAWWRNVGADGGLRASSMHPVTPMDCRADSGFWNEEHRHPLVLPGHHPTGSVHPCWNHAVTPICAGSLIFSRIFDLNGERPGR